MVLLKGCLKLCWVNITLERNLKLGILCLVNSAVKGCSLTRLNVTLSSVKVRVAWNNVALLYKVAEKDILSSTALVVGMTYSKPVRRVIVSLRWKNDVEPA